MPCIKTGCHIYLEPYAEYAYGDAFEIEPWLATVDQKMLRHLSQLGYLNEIKDTAYFNLVARSRNPINGLTEIHYVVHDWDNWFNNGEITGDVCRLKNSILITNNFTRVTRPINGESNE